MLLLRFSCHAILLACFSSRDGANFEAESFEKGLVLWVPRGQNSDGLSELQRAIAIHIGNIERRGITLCLVLLVVLAHALRPFQLLLLDFLHAFFVHAFLLEHLVHLIRGLICKLSFHMLQVGDHLVLDAERNQYLCEG